VVEKYIERKYSLLASLNLIRKTNHSFTCFHFEKKNQIEIHSDIVCLQELHFGVFFHVQENLLQNKFDKSK